MSASIRARLRRLWLNLHLWVGAGLFVVLVPLGLSGSALVWGQGIDRLAYPARYAVSEGPAALAPSVYLDAAAKAFGARAKPTQLRLPDEPGQPVTVTGRRAGKPAPGARPPLLTAWIDPPTGRVLDVADPLRSARGFVHRLHGQLLIPQVGRKVVGWLGWAMFANCATGLWLWWPRGALLKGLRWRRSSSTLNNLHHVVGFWIALPLAALSLSGVYIAFPKTSHALFGAPPPQGRPEPQAPSRDHEESTAGPTLSLDEAVAAALKADPSAKLSAVSLPERHGPAVWKIQLREPGIDQPAGYTVDAAGAVSRARSHRESDPFSAWVRGVHDGGGTGIVWQTIIFAAGLAPTVLGVTGIVMWLRRRRLRRLLRRDSQI